MRKINIAIIFLLLLVNTITSPSNAASNGKNSEFFEQNTGIKVKPKSLLNEALTVNGNMLINDGTQGLNYILGTDSNGHAFWSDARNFPEFDGNGKDYNHIIVENGFFQDLTLNGLITVDGRLKIPGIANGYVLTMQSNGNAHWGPNYGSNGTSNDPLWQEAFNTIFPKTNGGEMNLVIGDNNISTAEIVFTKNGAAAFNRGQASTEDFNVGSDQSFFAIKVETDDDQVGIKMGSPDTRLDVNGMFGLRAGKGIDGFTGGGTCIGGPSDPPTWGSITQNGTSTTTMGLNRPAPTVLNDTLLTVITVNHGTGTTPTATVPSGWSLEDETRDVSNDFTTYIYTKKATGAEPASYDFVYTGALNISGIMINYGGSTIGDPILELQKTTGTLDYTTAAPMYTVVAPALTTVATASHKVLRIRVTNYADSGHIATMGQTSGASQSVNVGFDAYETIEEFVETGVIASRNLNLDNFGTVGAPRSDVGYIVYTILIDDGSSGADGSPACSGSGSTPIYSTTGSDYKVTPDPYSSVHWVAENSNYGNNGDVLTRINNGAQDKIFKLVDFLGTTNGVKTQNGIELTNLTANRLVSSDANKALVSEEGIRVAGTGYVGFGTSRPLAKGQVADAVLNHVDGIDDLSVEGDIEADGTIYATNFVGDTIGLHFNGVTIRNAKIYTSTIFEILDFNGGAQIRPFDAPLYLDANLEFKGNSEYRAGNRFQLRGAPSENPEVSFHVANGRVGINTITPTAEFDLNATLAIRDGSQQNGFVLRAVNSIGNTQWEFIDSENVAFAANADNATTANFADAMINGTITDSDFINGNINGATLTNVDLTGAEGASEWLEGADGLYPKDGAAEDVMVGGTTLASSTISLESNGTLRAVRFSGDFSGASNIYYNQEWNDQGSYMFPFDLAGAEGMIIGGNTPANADSIFNPDGSVIINEQAQNADTKIEGQANEFLFHTDGSSSRVSINTDNPRTTLELNGSLSFATRIAAVSVGSGLAGSEIQNSRVIFLESTGSCNVDFTASPQIAAGEDGQIITLIGRYSDEAITLDDGDGLALADNTSLSLRAKDSITLMYVASLGEWIEIHRTNYIERAGDTLNRGTCT